MTAFPSIEELVAHVAEGVRPPERLSIVEAAEKHRRINNPAVWVGPWSRTLTPYMNEVQEVLQSLEFTACVFVGPAQSGKTDVILNWANHSVIYDPMDFMAIHPTQVAARDFSRRRVDRLHRESAEMRKRLVPKRESDSVYYKQYRNGMILNQSWPTISELSGRPIGRLWLTDYDRMTDDVDGEGSPFDLARKRATTFGRYGMTVAESSPGRVVTNPKWMPSLPHEAPPTTGILALYNRGDRRRWYWPCDHCHRYFEPEFDLLSYDTTVDHLTAGEGAWMACPHCGGQHFPDRKAELNNRGVWLKAGQRFDDEGNIVGEAIRSDIASFWLKGVAAAFADWKTLVVNYLKAEEEYARTGDEGALQTTINTDQGLPYTPKGVDSDRLPETLKARAEELGEKEVPPGVRFLLASVDVQKNRFEVGVHGICPGGDIAVVDRFAIRKSERVDDDGDPWPVAPGAYPEDWDLIKTRVMDKSYPLGDGSGRRMAIKLTACDSGGVLGVTTRAYEFYRRLKADGDHKRFLLVKGASSKTAPRVQLSYPDSERKDRHAGARGEIPVLMIHTNLLKDQLNTLLDREEPFGGMVRFPDWLPDTYYAELTAEVRTEKGWENPRKLRNEAWDLLVYCLALMRSHFIRAEFLDWDNPPGWAADWDDNDLVFDPEINKPFETQPKGAYDFSKYAEELA
ncbi:phage terminase large subunit family protein [Billgrantia desiderata]|uniref:phage terminase large subunit family protein n=1 Tax=Billgrantia desiderata TaxID=52021 RepID=UPI001F2C9697|nr:terminase gpA endonuclease subunit [Halomonas desiderata]MCE8012880.1 terminase [Halomonas desiderata]